MSQLPSCPVENQCAGPLIWLNKTRQTKREEVFLPSSSIRRHNCTLLYNYTMGSLAVASFMQVCPCCLSGVIEVCFLQETFLDFVLFFKKKDILPFLIGLSRPFVLNEAIFLDLICIDVIPLQCHSRMWHSPFPVRTSRERAASWLSQCILFSAGLRILRLACFGSVFVSHALPGREEGLARCLVFLQNFADLRIFSLSFKHQGGLVVVQTFFRYLAR